MLRYLPFAALVILAGAFAFTLTSPKDNSLPSPLIGKPLPQLSVPALGKNTSRLDSAQWKNHVVVLNFFASWCVPCSAEHPLLKTLAEQKGVMLVGIAWRDNPEAVSAWLEARGNPYASIGIDSKGTTTTLLGLTGVPETYIIDKQGKVSYRLAAPLDTNMVETTILPLIRKLNNAP